MSIENTQPKTTAELEAMIAQLKAEKAELVKRDRSEFELAVGEKGGVSVYGLGSRFPTTLYAQQWDVVLNNADVIRKFIADNMVKIEANRVLAQAKALAEKSQKQKSG